MYAVPLSTRASSIIQNAVSDEHVLKSLTNSSVQLDLHIIACISSTIKYKLKLVKFAIAYYNTNDKSIIYYAMFDPAKSFDLNLSLSQSLNLS